VTTGKRQRSQLAVPAEALAEGTASRQVTQKGHSADSVQDCQAKRGKTQDGCGGEGGSRAGLERQRNDRPTGGCFAEWGLSQKTCSGCPTLGYPKPFW